MRVVSGSDPYRHSASYYDRVIEPLLAALREIGMALLPPRPGLRVLDVCCGTGTLLARYAQRGCEVAGVDRSPAMLSVAAHKGGPRGRLAVADAGHLPYGAGSFDLVLFTMCLHEMPRPVRPVALAEARRVLAADGRLLIVDYHPGRLSVPRGWLQRALITVIEAAGGWEHFSGYRSFLRAGGVPGLAAEARAEVDAAKIVAGGNLGLFVLRPR